MRLIHWTVSCAAVLGTLFITAPASADCGYKRCPETDLANGAVTTEYSGAKVGEVVGAGPVGIVDYVWRLRDPCVVSDERNGDCSRLDFQDCPAAPGQVVDFLTVEQRPVVRPDGTAVVPVPPGFGPGEPIGVWNNVRTGCIDITALNPPPSPEEVFTYFQRLPLPQLATEQAPPGKGLSGLPMVFWTDSPATQTFTVDIRGFAVVIVARAEQYTWHTGDPASPTLTSTEPGGAYPDQAVEHLYRSGTYTANLTVTWGATFTVDGSAPADVPGTTTTDGPPVTFDVVEAAAVLTDPYD